MFKTDRFGRQYVSCCTEGGCLLRKTPNYIFQNEGRVVRQNYPRTLVLSLKTIHPIFPVTLETGFLTRKNTILYYTLVTRAVEKYSQLLYKYFVWPDWRFWINRTFLNVKIKRWLRSVSNRLCGVSPEQNDGALNHSRS